MHIRTVSKTKPDFNTIAPMVEQSRLTINLNVVARLE